MHAEHAALVTVLTEARELGFLGPGPVEGQLAHAHAFVDVVASQLPQPGTTGRPAGSPGGPRLADLGSGGGVPGLVLACRMPAARVTLVEASARRAAFLARACNALGVVERVSVLHDRAERVGRMPEHRAAYAAVTARSFASPAVTVECAAPLLQAGGRLVVAEPPGPADAAAPPADATAPPADAAAPPADPAGPAEPDEGAALRDDGRRWPAAGLAAVGMGPAVPQLRGFHFVVISQLLACGERYPRRTGVPSKRPLF